MPDQKKTIQFNTTPDEVVSRSAMDRAKSRMRPVGGVPPVRIPPLDSDPVEGGGSMQDQAAVLSDPTSPLSPAYSPELAAMRPSASQQRPQAPTSSPRIAIKAPQQAPGRPPLSAETVEGIQAVQDYQKRAEEAQREAAEQAERAQQEAAAKDAEKRERGIDELRNLLGDDTQWSRLNNPERRKRIESRCAPLDISDIVVRGEIQQVVPIVPDKLIIVYRTPSGAEDLGVKFLIGEEHGADRYMMDKFTMMSLALGVVSINNAELVPCVDANRTFNKEAFQKKLEQLLRYPLSLLTDIALNYFWFDQRVQALLADQTDALKNS